MVSPARAKELQEDQLVRDQQVLDSLQDWRDNLEAQRLAHLLADLISLGVGGIGVGVVTESYVTNAINTAISNLVSTAPSTLNTLVELAASINNDANFATTILNALANKLAIDYVMSLTTLQKNNVFASLGLTSMATASTNDFLSVANSRYVFVINSGSTYIVPASVITENGRTIVELNNSSLTSITVNAATATGKSVGDSVNISIIGTYAAQVLVEGSGVSLQGDLTFSYQHQTKTLVYKGSNVWKVVG